MHDLYRPQVMSLRWSSEQDRTIFNVENPATGRVIARVRGGTRQTVDRAVTAAHEAFRNDWSKRSASERGGLLILAAEHLAIHADEIANLVSMENGKPVRDARAFDVASLIGSFKYFGELASKPQGTTLDLGSLYSVTVREPYGVVAGIIPFNWPPIHTGAKAAPALAMGNTIVLKPGEQAPLAIIRIVELLQEVLPPDVIHVVPGAGPEVGIALTEHPLIRKISFTGAPETGTAVLRAAATHHVPVLLELGGKNPFIVFPDADLDVAVRDAVEGAFFNKGEACTAASRILLHEEVHDAFLEKFCQAVSKLVVGNGADDSTHVGPVVSAAQQKKVLDYINVGVEEGAVLAAEAALPSDPSLAEGYFVAATVLSGVTRDMRVAKEEIFGPVASVIKFRDEQDAIEIANSTRFGLVAGVYSQDAERANRVARSVEAGIVFINNYNRVVLGSGFGGTKASGYGREHCAETLNEFSYMKTLRVPTGNPPVARWVALDSVFAE